MIVVAHADDEVLGCGGTAARLAAKGCKVSSCILSSKAEARRGRPKVSELLDDTRKAQLLLGFQPPILGEFPNIRFSTVPHLDIVAFIEAAIRKVKPTIIFTHHPQDLNDDHRQTSRACQAAARLAQREGSLPSLRGLYFMEVLSATDWAFPGNGDAFSADTFFEIGEDFLSRKLSALRAYRGVMREFPHPRSEEIIRGLAGYRGGQAGMKYAEAFQTAFQVLTIPDGEE